MTGRKEKLDAIQNTPETVADCFDCNEGPNTEDLNTSKNWLTNQLEHVTNLNKTDEEANNDCAIGTNTSLVSAAKQLYEEAVKNAEEDETLTVRTIVKKSGGQNAGFSKQNTDARAPGEPGGTVLIFQTKGDDCITEDIEPIVLAKYEMAGWDSALTYPKTLDCDGEPIYLDRAGLPINHHKFPDEHLVPLFYSTQKGVETQFDPANTPGKDTYVVMLGIQVENVYIPSYEKGEIPKPLDTNMPWRIVMGKRERHNQTVMYSGYFTNTFKGKIGNKEYAVPRHAANAYPNVDRSILTDTGSHLGEDWNEPLYTFHSPDLGTATEFINGDYVKITSKLRGDGSVYGLYVEGKDVKDEEHRLDRRGARSAMNFSSRFRGEEFDVFQTCLKGAEFAEHNSNLQNPEGISKPLLNKYRESSIYLETAEVLPRVGTAGKDKSFNVGGLDHFYNTKGEVLYGDIKRFNSQQYGSIESLQYVDIGIAGKPGETGARVLTGDTFVGKWSDKRSSYISDKVGDKLNVDYPITAHSQYLGPTTANEGRDRGVCDPPNRRTYRMREFFGMWNELELPLNGDKRDPKNMANGHPTKSAFDIWGADGFPGTAAVAETDLYYPRTLNHLNHLVVQADTNLYYRSTSQPATREVFYEELQGLDVDSSINQVDPEDAWLPDWHNEHKQPTKKQLNKRAMIRFALIVGGFLLSAGAVAGIETSLEAGATFLTAPFFAVLWAMLVKNILSGKKLNNLLGFPPCKEDNDGAQGENNTKGLKDNWNAYNYGFSDVNSHNQYFGIPAVYNTCRCDDKLTNLIYSSNMQIDTSNYDAWGNFQALSYTGLSGDSGQLQRLFVWGNGSYAQTTDGLYQLQQKNASISSTGGELILNGSGYVDVPVKMLDGVYEGFGGTSDPNSAIVCTYGYIWPDYEARQIQGFNGKMDSYTGRNSGLYHTWQDKLAFCEKGCRDQLSPGGTHFTFGYDPEYQLLTITKHDGSRGFTVSYDLAEGHYVSEHDYVPDFYFWDRFKLYSMKDGNIIRHNVPGGFCTYGGQEFSASVDVVARSKASESFTYQNSVLDTEVIHNGLNDRDETFNYLTAWNEFQQTGRLPIINEDQLNAYEQTKDKPQISISRRELGKWKLNNFKSNELDRDVPVVVPEACGIGEVVNEKNIDPNPPTQKAKTIKGKYLIQRLEFNKNDRQIILFGMHTHSTTPDEK